MAAAAQGYNDISALSRVETQAMHPTPALMVSAIRRWGALSSSRAEGAFCAH